MLMTEILATAPKITENIGSYCKDTLKCMQCGVCSGSCPSGRETALNIRKLVRKATRDKDVLSSEQLWMCTTCYSCQERCPRNIAIVDMVLALRSMAAHMGLMRPEHVRVSQMLMEYGHAVPIDEQRRAQRIELGLDELPLTVLSFPKELEEIKTLLASCRFDVLVKTNRPADAKEMK